MLYTPQPLGIIGTHRPVSQSRCLGCTLLKISTTQAPPNPVPDSRRHILAPALAWRIASRVPLFEASKDSPNEKCSFHLSACARRWARIFEYNSHTGLRKCRGICTFMARGEFTDPIGGDRKRFCRWSTLIYQTQNESLYPCSGPIP